MRDKNIFHRPLHVLDAEGQTWGCRHTNPDICAKNGLEGVCAFVRSDNICHSPPKSWPKQFRSLKKLKEEAGQ